MSEPVVLYVDDDAANRLVFQQSFQHRFRLEVFASGEAAIERLAAGPVAVVLTDQRMPGMSGNELLACVREISPDTVGVVITAFDDVDPILQAVNSGLVGRYIVKPWAVHDIVNAVRWASEVYAIACLKRDLEIKLLEGERFATLGAISAGILHDLRQPLSVLVVTLDALMALVVPMQRFGDSIRQRKLTGLDFDPGVAQLAHEYPEIVRDVGVAIEQVRAVAESGMRFVAKKRSGGERGDARAAAHYAVTLCGQAVRTTGQLRHAIGTDLPPLALDTGSLTRTLVNLILNAAYAIDGRPDGLVELSVQTEGDGVAVTVRDNGSGMAPEVLARAGGPFYTTKPAGVGSGLGLYNTGRMLDEVGGSMTIQSVPDAGTTVKVWIPESWW